MGDKLARRPVIDPLLLALKSRRVIVALCALAVGLLVLLVPGLQPVQDEVLVLLISLTLAVIGGYSLEDAAQVGRNRAAVPNDEMRELVKDVLTGLVDEFADRNRQPSEENGDG